MACLLEVDALVVAAVAAVEARAVHRVEAAEDDEAVVKDTLDRLSMGQAYADAETFRANMKRDNEQFKALVTKLGIKA